MATTTLKLSDELKKRIARLVEGSDTTMHAFLVRAVEQATIAAEKRAEFVAAALKAREEYQRTRRGYSLEQVSEWARKRAASQKVARPKARTWR